MRLIVLFQVLHVRLQPFNICAITLDLALFLRRRLDCYVLCQPQFFMQCRQLGLRTADF
jgi:hypothetical protein